MLIVIVFLAVVSLVVRESAVRDGRCDDDDASSERITYLYVFIYV